MWICLPNLPIEYYDKGFLLRMGSRIGCSVKVDEAALQAEVDEATLQAARGKYTRICVKVDFSKPFLSKF